jgi:hypothetical protein
MLLAAMGSRRAWCSAGGGYERRGREAVRADDDVVPAAELRRLEERVRDLEQPLKLAHLALQSAVFGVRHHLLAGPTADSAPSA